MCKKQTAENMLPKLLEKNRTREELAQILGVSDSTVRGFVSKYAQKNSVISHHLRLGYKKATDKDDIGEVILAAKILESENRVIRRRIKAHKKFLIQNGVNLKEVGL